MLTCKDVTHLLSEGQDRKLTVAERVRLEMHLAICDGCANYRKQMNFIRSACQRYIETRRGDDGGPDR